MTIFAAPDVRVFATVGSMDDIHAALRDRFKTLELSRATIDAAAGLSDGYASKALAMPPIKRFGHTTLFPTLEVAGLRLALIEDPEALARTQKLPIRAHNAVRERVSRRLVDACRTEVLRELTSKAGKARMTKMTAAARKRIAKAAARARWSKRKGTRS